ncbi:MAG: SIR2 family protein [Pseudomonadales bacterium]
MARLRLIDNLQEADNKALTGALQSAHLNFLIGSGASLPAIPAAGNVESRIAELFAEDREREALTAMYEFLRSIQSPMNRLIRGEADGQNDECVSNYSDLLALIEIILVERRTDLLPKQANVFTTNYDLFIEKASESHAGIRLNDGFARVPSLERRMVFSPQSFFDATFSTGSLYNYKVEVPAVNLIKLHGSFSWKANQAGEVTFHVAAADGLGEDPMLHPLRVYVRQFAGSVVLPQVQKFRETIMNQTYYDLLRIYQNQLDKENSLLISFGFSFGDEHILDITRRALKNITLKMIVVAYDEAAAARYQKVFQANSNVEILAPADGETIDFSRLVEFLRRLVPTRWSS